MSATPKIVDHIEQSDATAMTLTAPCEYISITNDSAGDITFAPNSVTLQSAITVKQNETWSGFFKPFTSVTIVNAGSSDIRADFGRWN